MQAQMTNGLPHADTEKADIQRSEEGGPFLAPIEHPPGWTPLARALESDYDVVLPDARGHGRSGVPADGYRYEDLAADVVGLIGCTWPRRAGLAGPLHGRHDGCRVWQAKILGG